MRAASTTPDAARFSPQPDHRAITGVSMSIDPESTLEQRIARLEELALAQAQGFVLSHHLQQMEQLAAAAPDAERTELAAHPETPPAHQEPRA